MKRLFYYFPKYLFCILLFSLAVSAQSAKNVNQKTENEFTRFRQQLSGAIKNKDRKSLETTFADDFTHTHAIGKVDGKLQRINSILEGGKTLETVEPDEIEIRFYGKNTAVAVGQTTIDETVYRWTVVYVKNKKNWQIAASQATRIS